MAEIDALTLDRLTVAGLREHREMTGAELKVACERYINGHYQFRRGWSFNLLTAAPDPV